MAARIQFNKLHENSNVEKKKKRFTIFFFPFFLRSKVLRFFFRGEMVYFLFSRFFPLYVIQVEISGLTGVIKFDNQGFRTDFELDVVEVNKEGLYKIGTWNSSQGINFTRSFVEAYSNIVDNLHNKTLVVTLILVSAFALANNIRLIMSETRVITRARGLSG